MGEKLNANVESTIRATMPTAVSIAAIVAKKYRRGLRVRGDDEFKDNLVNILLTYTLTLVEEGALTIKLK